MDFTQIMQRYVRLKEKFNRNELDSDTFEEQVNKMVYKDNLGRYWQIGVESGKWYYYDGEKWVQDNLLEDDNDDEAAQVEQVVEDAPEFSVENFFSSESDEDGSSTKEAFDLAFEEQLAEQFANSSDSQQFDLFNEEDIFAGLLGHEPLDEDELMAPAEDVEGLAEHLMVTQPVSIENWMGEGEAFSGFQDDDQGIDFLFDDDDGESKSTPEVEEFTDEDLAALLFDDNNNEDEDPFEDIRPVRSERDIVTGELGLKVEPVSEDEIHELIGFNSFEEEDATVSSFPVKGQNFFTEEYNLPSGDGFEIIENEDDLAELPWDVSEEFLASTQPVLAQEQDEDQLEADLFDLPQLEPVPQHESEPMLETMQSVKPSVKKPKKKNKKQWIIIGIAVLAGLILIGVILIGAYYLLFKGGTGFSPLAQEGNSPQLEQGVTYDDFSDPNDGWPTLSDYSVGVSAYNSGFYYLYAIAPEPSTIAVLTKAGYSDVTVEIDTTQIELDGGTLSTYGLMCRVQENGDGYAFRITNNGQYVIEKYVGGIFQPINGWKFSEGIKAGKDVNKNHLEMYCEGNQLTFIVNGQVLDIVIDDQFSSGFIAFIAQTGSAEVDTEVHYDDLYLKVP